MAKLAPILLSQISSGLVQAINFASCTIICLNIISLLHMHSCMFALQEKSFRFVPNTLIGHFLFLKYAWLKRCALWVYTSRADKNWILNVGRGKGGTKMSLMPDPDLLLRTISNIHKKRTTSPSDDLTYLYSIVVLMSYILYIQNCTPVCFVELVCFLSCLHQGEAQEGNGSDISL